MHNNTISKLPALHIKACIGLTTYTKYMFFICGHQLGLAGSTDFPAAAEAEEFGSGSDVGGLGVYCKPMLLKGNEILSAKQCFIVIVMDSAIGFFVTSVYSERERRYMLSSVCRRLFVVCLSSVTVVRSTEAIEIFGNVATPFGIHWPFVTFRQKFHGDRPWETPPNGEGVKAKRSSQI